MGRAGPASRWRRRALVVLAALAVCYGALLVVRATRSYVRVPEREFLRTERPLVIAHRGGPGGGALEHTLAAQRAAVRAGADVLEIDLRLTKDGIPVVAHDESLARRLELPLAIAGHDLAELRDAVSARHRGEAGSLLLTFEDVLVQFPGQRLNVELKTDDAALADAVAALVDRHDAHDRVLAVSFHGDVLDRLRERTRGRVATGASSGEAARFFLCYAARVPCRPAFEALQIPRSLGSGWLSLDLDDRDFVAFAHRHGVAVHYWTIDDARAMRRLVSVGADGIITDHPGRGAAVVRERDAR